MELYIVYNDNKIHYNLTRKKIKNLNLRVKSDGKVYLSAPLKTSQKYIDAFLISKADWILKSISSMPQNGMDTICNYTDGECLDFFMPIVEKYYPLFEEKLKGEFPIIKVRAMKSRWGVCYVQRNQILLNKWLLEKPLPAVEYVVLHEFCHFYHPNHQKDFHDLMFSLMPDYKIRKKLLKS